MEVLQKIYYDPKQGFNSAIDLYEKAIKFNPSISMSDVKQFLKQQKSYQITTQTRKQPYHKIVCFNDSYFGDITFFSNPKNNNGYIGLFTIIECTSRFVYAFPVKSKQITEYINIFNQFLKLINNKIDVFTSDNEFGGKFNKLLEEKGIVHVFEDPYKHSKLNLLNSFHFTLKKKLEKYFIANNTDRWIDVIDDIIFNYNNTKHSTLKDTPANVYNNEELKAKIRDKLTELNRVSNELKNSFKIGDKVRHMLRKNKFEKNYSKFSDNIYVIHDIAGNSFTLKNPENDYILKQTYQYHELKKVDDVNEYQPEVKQPMRQTKTEKKTEKKMKEIAKELGNSESGKLKDSYKWNREHMKNVDLLNEPRKTRSMKGNGIVDQIGPTIWRLIHLTSKYKPNNLKSLINYLVDNFPCENCRMHLKKYVLKNPITENFEYTFKLHNSVNKRLGKPILTFQQAYSLY